MDYKFVVKNRAGCIIATLRDENELDYYRRNGLIDDNDKIIEIR